MIFSLEWLNEYGKITSSAQQLSESLTMRADEVEEIINHPTPVLEAKLVKISAIKKHPNADRLKLVEIQIGKTKKTVVCGASNISIGDTVPYIEVGNHYFDDEANLVELRPIIIRGEKSEGMLASQRDLGLSSTHEGILIVNEENKEKDLKTYLGFSQSLLKLEITPNRSDLFSYFGLAREISLIEKNRLNDITVESLSIASNKSNPQVDIVIDTKDCLRYAVVVIDGATNRQSPKWLANRLLLSGINPINAIVDITNYVMLELGQPLHAFDFHKLDLTKEIANIIVRKAKSGETINSLDGTKIELNKSDTIITNNNEAIAMAGIVGANNSKIESTTTKIVLEAAIFKASSIRKSSLKHNVRTESSTRFEKGVDPQLPVIALKRAVSLIKEICDGEVIGRLHDLSNERFEKKRINISLLNAEKSLGFSVDRIKIKNLLSSIGFSISSIGKEGLSIIVPSWRLDIEIEEDIFEEIARLYGYENIKSTALSGSFKTPNKQDNYWSIRKIRNYLQRRNIFEAVSQPFIGDKDKNLFKLDHLVEIQNPTTKNEKYLRSLISIPLIKRVMSESRNVDEVNYFETGKVFNSKDSISEHESLALISLTKDATASARLHKDLIIGLGQVLSKANSIKFKSKPSTVNFLADNIETINFQQAVLGNIGVLKDNIQQQGKVRGARNIVISEINLELLLRASSKEYKIQNSSIYPAIVRDISLEIKNGTIAEAVARVNSKQIDKLVDCSVNDIFENEDGTKFITLRYVFQSFDSTLKDEFVNNQINILVKNINSSQDLNIRE